VIEGLKENVEAEALMSPDAGEVGPPVSISEKEPRQDDENPTDSAPSCFQNQENRCEEIGRASCRERVFVSV
jgi:hypothetical protein